MTGPRKTRRPAAVLAAAWFAAACLALAACVPTTPSEESTMTDEPATSAPGADLRVSLRPDGETVDAEYRLVCVDGVPADGTDHPNPEAACAFLSGTGQRVLTAVPAKNRMCTQQYGGPQVAVVEGTIDGRRVLKTFSLRDGCQISEWRASEALLGPGSAGGV